jgi:hypothetical protein
MRDEDNLYCECGKPATWVRKTQFAGTHPYCTEYAKRENDFGRSDSSYFFWKELSPDKIAPEHKTAVEGYEDLSQILCERIHRLRYDKVEEFYRHSAAELRRQAASDRAKGRIQLASLLEEAATVAEEQQKRFARIWKICEPHMKLWSAKQT